MCCIFRMNMTWKISSKAKIPKQKNSTTNYEHYGMATNNTQTNLANEYTNYSHWLIRCLLLFFNFAWISFSFSNEFDVYETHSVFGTSKWLATNTHDSSKSEYVNGNDTYIHVTIHAYHWLMSHYLLFYLFFFC